MHSANKLRQADRREKLGSRTASSSERRSTIALEAELMCGVKFAVGPVQSWPTALLAPAAVEACALRLVLDGASKRSVTSTPSTPAERAACCASFRDCMLSSGVARRSAASIMAAWVCFAERSASRCEFHAICALKNDLRSGFQPISLAISSDLASTSGLQ